MTPQEAEQAAKAARPAPPPPPPRTEPPPTEPATFAEAYEDPQSDTLEEAATEGVALLQECEPQELVALEGAPPEPAVLVFADPQADTLEEAAEEGAMLCEI